MKKISYSFTALGLLIFSTAFATPLFPQKPYYTKNFYDEAQKTAPELKVKSILFEVLSKAHRRNMTSGFDELFDDCTNNSCFRQRTMDYRFARRVLFGRIDLLQDSEGYALKDVYCGRIYTRKDFPNGQPPAPNRIPNPEVLNTEHTWPQSKFSSRFPTELQKGDLHILYPVSPRANSSRSNHPFNNVTAERSSPCAGASLGFTGRSNVLSFEPPDSHKGNAARSIFYFSVRYQMPVDADQEETLRQWHRMDPVDEIEQRRNEEIFKAQGNRNPFIDHPELTELIQDF